MNIISEIKNTEKIILANFTEVKSSEGSVDKSFDEKYDKFNKKSGIVFSEDIKNLYREKTYITLSWFNNDSSLYGSFDLIPIDMIAEFHDDMLDIAESSKEYAVGDSAKQNLYKLDIISRMYPIFDFVSGDKICIDCQNGKAVFFDYSVFELGDLDINGTVLADSYEDLIGRWSKILFMEGFWWYKEENCVNENGINLECDFFKDFLKTININANK